ncbi:MAG: CinA family protein [Spirochaetia bacterium]|jgi:PncC family amidohydrolase|nr:CinA family protein [Spirochaetia bacterium]
MDVFKKIRFFIISPVYLGKICEEKKIPHLDYSILTDEYGVVLKIVSGDKEYIKIFLESLPKDLMFFSGPDFDCHVADLAAGILLEKDLKLSVVESCTGGLIGKMATDKPGSSSWFWGGFITYDNSAKRALGVPAGIIEKYGAVSRETVESMAEMGLEKSESGICVSVSGIAGPVGGSFEKPVGTVWIGVKKETTSSYRFLFSGSRGEIRDKAAQAALLIVYKKLLNKAGVDSNIFEYYI